MTTNPPTLDPPSPAPTCKGCDMATYHRPCSTCPDPEEFHRRRQALYARTPSPAPAAPGGVGEPTATLTHDLEVAAWGMERLGDMEVSRRLRAAAKRIRSEFLHVRPGGYLEAALFRINGGSTPAPTGDEP